MDETLGQLLKGHRRRRNLTQARLAQQIWEQDTDLSGLDRAAICRWEGDKRLPPPRHLLAHQRALLLTPVQVLSTLEAAAKFPGSPAKCAVYQALLSSWASRPQISRMEKIREWENYARFQVPLPARNPQKWNQTPF